MTTPNPKPGTKRGTGSNAIDPSKPARRPRDAAATAQHIAAAALQLMTEKGFASVGVNAIASAAGVDKQLIYYYFGGLDGLIRHLGADLNLWLGTPLQPIQGEAYALAANRLLVEYVGALRKNKLVLQLLTWELVEQSEVLTELEAARSTAMAGWVSALRMAAQPAPRGIDAPAINALLIAGLHYLTLREQTIGTFAGMDIRSAEGLARIEGAVKQITTAVFADPAGPEVTSP